jgi:hypothetical protein
MMIRLWAPAFGPSGGVSATPTRRWRPSARRGMSRDDPRGKAIRAAWEGQSGSTVRPAELPSVCLKWTRNAHLSLSGDDPKQASGDAGGCTLDLTQPCPGARPPRSLRHDVGGPDHFAYPAASSCLWPLNAKAHSSSNLGFRSVRRNSVSTGSSSASPDISFLARQRGDPPSKVFS